MLLLIRCLLLPPLCVCVGGGGSAGGGGGAGSGGGDGVLYMVLVCYVVHIVHSSFTIILMGKRELFALL